MSNVIDLKGISWRRDEKTILRDVNWQVAKGQHWAVLGLNGSGKTTILNMINGYIWPTTGTVSVLGHELGRLICGSCADQSAGSARRCKRRCTIMILQTMWSSVANMLYRLV